MREPLMMMPKILCFSGSTRTGAFSTQTMHAAANAIAETGATVTTLSLGDYDMPIVNQDLEREKGIPEAAMRLARMIAAHDGLLIASPEYNASIPPLLKNTLDWLSRVKTDGSKPLRPFEGKTAAICGSSPGALGGMRMLPHLRQVLMNLGLQVITEQVAVGSAENAFDHHGDLVNERVRQQMATLARELVYRARNDADRV